MPVQVNSSTSPLRLSVSVLFALLFVIAFSRLYGQQEGESTRSETIHVPIATITLREGNTATATLTMGSDVGLAEGTVGEFLSIGGADGIASLGSVKVTVIGKESATVRVVLADKEASAGTIRAGDLGAFTLELPAEKSGDDPSLIFDLARLAITMEDDSGQPLYSLSDALLNDSEEAEQEILGRMLDAVHNTAERLRAAESDDPTFSQPMTGGRFQGELLLDAMQRSTVEDIRSFLLFVIEFPGKYMGRPWKVDETYATWILNETPLSGEDLLIQLYNAPDDQTFAEIVQRYRVDILGGGFLYDWLNEAERIGVEGEFADADRLNGVAMEAAELLEEKEALAWTQYVAGRIRETALEYEEAAEAYRVAAENFEAAEAPNGRSFALNNLGSVLYSLGRYDEAGRAYDESMTLKRVRAEVEGTPEAYDGLAYTVSGRGSVYAATGDYRKALETYRRSIRLYDSAGTGSGGTGVAWVMRREADMLGNLGRYDESIESLNRALEIYRDADVPDGEADVLDQIAYQYSNLGRYRESLETYEAAYALHLKLGDKKDAGFSKSNVGQMYWSLGDYYNAEKSHRLAILLREEAEDISGQAYSWHKLGEMFRESGDPNAALEAFKRAIELYDQAGEPANRASVLNSMGDVYYGEKSWSNALDRYDRALEIERSIDDTEGIAQTLYNIGNVYFGQGNYGKARGPFEESLRLRREAGDRSNEVYNLTSIGLVDWNLRDYEGARARFNEALQLATELESKSDVAWCHAVMARVSTMKGEYASAMNDFERALGLYREIGDRSSEVDILLGIGEIYVQRGKFDEGLERFNEALRIAEEINARNGIAGALSSIASVNLLLGSFQKAIDANMESLRISREVDNPWGIGAVLSGLGNSYNALGDYRKAIAFYNSSDSLYKSLGDTLSRATPINNSGTVYFFQGDYEQALDRFNTVLQILQAAGQRDEFLAIVLTNIGEVYFEQGRYDDAEVWLRQGLELADEIGTRRISASAMTILTKDLMAQDRMEAAVELGENALKFSAEIGELEQVAEINGVMGELELSRGNLKEAERYLIASIDISQQIGSGRYLWRPLYYLGTIRRDAGNTARAIDYLVQAVETIERLRDNVAGGTAAQKLFASDKAKINVYEALIALLIEQGEIERALGYLERSSSEDLRARFKSLQPSFADPKQQELLEQGKEMQARIDKLAQQIATERSSAEGENREERIERLQEIISIAENDYIKFVNETVREQPQLRNYFSSGVNPIELRQRKQKIPQDIAVVSYLLGEQSIFAFVATSDTVVARVIRAERSEVEAEVRAFYRGVASPGGSSELEKHAARLHELLIAPISDRIAGHDKLAIIPSGDLYYLPFGALRAGEGQPYLADRFTTFYVSDLGVFLEEGADEGDLRMVAFSNADGTLPNAEAEVRDIATLYPGTQVYVGDEATEERAKNFPQGYNALHFATHGTLDYRHFENSWLTLASDPADGEDGRLTLEEIWGITNLSDCRLVTLSACNTAVSDEVVEGWPINPANAFLQVGVPRVIATLWQVDDAATSRLMKEFYANLHEHGAAESLKLAQMSLASTQEYRSPYFWAPFILLGDWR